MPSFFWSGISSILYIYNLFILGFDNIGDISTAKLRNLINATL